MTQIEKCTFDQGRGAPHFSIDLSSNFGKKSGGFYKKRDLKALILLDWRFREIISVRRRRNHENIKSIAGKRQPPGKGLHLYGSARAEKDSGSRGHRSGTDASVVTCRRGGNTASFDVLNKYFTMTGMPVASSQYWNMVYGGSAE